MLKKYNLLLVKNELECLINFHEFTLGLHREDIETLSMIYLRYLNFTIYEMEKYFESIKAINTFGDFKKKRNIMRSKFKSSIKNIATIEEVLEFMNSKFTSKLFGIIFKNYGCYYYEGKYIGNIFDIYMFEKHLGVFSENKPNIVFDFSRNIGSMIRNYSEAFKIVIPYGNCKNKSIKSSSLDYKITFKNNKEDVLKVLIIYNKISLLNFCKYVFAKMTIQPNPLLIRYKYITILNTLKELEIIGFDYNSKELKFMKNGIFRNFMYHYGFPEKFENIDVSKIFFGVVEDVLKISEEEFIKELDNGLDLLIIYLYEIIETLNCNFRIKKKDKRYKSYETKS